MALGFTAQELARALSPAASTGLTHEDHVPDVAGHAVTRLGYIWCAGDHRLSCGSCTDDSAVAALFDGAAPHLMVTDPPYPIQSPYVSIATKYADVMTRIASEFGFTPASRGWLPSEADPRYLELLQLIGTVNI